MSAKDKIHDTVKNALIKDGWVITDDPYVLEYEEVTLYADLAAERPIAAERGEQKIVVEVKSFLSPSFIQDLKEAVGQYVIYLGYIEESEPDRKLYMALGEKIYGEFFQLKAVELILRKYNVALIVVDLEEKEIVKWIS